MVLSGNSDYMFSIPDEVAWRAARRYREEGPLEKLRGLLNEL